MKVIHIAGSAGSKIGGFEKHLIEINTQLIQPGDNLELTFPVYPQSTLLVEELKTQNIPFHVIPEIVGIKGKIACFIDYFRLFLRIKVDVVHVNFTSHAYIILLAAYFAGVKKRYYTEHCMPRYANTMKQSFVMSLLSSLCNNVIGVSDAVTAVFIDKFKFKNAITLYLGLDCGYNTQVNDEIKFIRENIDSSTMIITNIAFHNAVKGVDILLEAIALLRNKVDVKFKVFQIGETSTSRYSKSLLEFVKQNNLGNIVEFMGIREDVSELLEISDIYCNASRSEALPFVLLEASRANCPIVATNVGGVSELIKDSVNGFLIKAEDADAMSERLKLLILDPNLRRTMGARANSMFIDKFNLKTQVKKLINLYNAHR